MKSCIISDREDLASRIRQTLIEAGHDCPADYIIPHERAHQYLSLDQPELVVVEVGPDPEQVISGLGRLRQLAGAPLLAIGPVSEPRLILRALREGATDYLDTVELATELPAALDRISAGPVNRSDPARTIAIVGAGGGSGASTLAASLGVALAKDHKTTCLFDLRLSTGDLAALLDLKPTHTLADLCLNVARMDLVFFERTLASHPTGVKLLASPRQYGSLDLITPTGIAQVLGLARASFPYILGDVDPCLRDEQLYFLSQADMVLLLVRLDFATLRNARLALDHMERRGVPREKVRLVASRYGQPKEVPAAKAEEALNLRFFHQIPEDAKSVNRANNSGVPVILDYPSAPYSRSVARLASLVHAHFVPARSSRGSEERAR